MSNHERHEELRQELLEFYFDCHPEPEAMAERLEHDAELAALFEEVKQTAAVLEEAATDEAPPLDLSTTESAPSAAPSAPPTTMPAVKKQRGFGFRQVWYAAAALFVIAMIPALCVYGYRAWEVHDVETSKVRVLLAAPPGIPDGSPLRFHVETLDLASRKMATQVDWKVLDDDGTTLSESTTMCSGATDITVAGTLNKPRKLVVTARVPGSGFTRTVEQIIHPSKSAPLVHVTSDKPAYRPGETVMLRIACLDRLTLRSADRIGLRCRIVDPKDSKVLEHVLPVGKGVAAWTWRIPAHSVGGNYALEVRDSQDKFTLERLPFLVRNFQPPKLKKKITLDRHTYAAGQKGAADLHVTRAGGGPAAGAKVHATLVVDGDETWKGDAELDNEGRALFKFAVPSNVRKGAARFVTRVTDGGNVETELKPFVIPTDKVEMLLYPEGGELIAGTENRVYAQLEDALGRPLSGRGRVVDDLGKEVGQFQTQHFGRTRFAFTPVMGRSYKAELESPFKKHFDLPKVHDTGAVVRPVGDHFAAGKDAKVQVFTAGPGPWIATVFCRGVLAGQQSILERGLNTVSIPLVDEASGVLRVTVFDRKMRPVAERLVMRDGKRNLTVALTPDKARVKPGQKQKVKLRVTDETGEPVSGIVGLTVTDRAVADMLDFTRVGLDDQRHLFTDVEKPDEKVEEFLKTHEKYRRNVDLLLGCLGWRRYVWRGDATEEALVAKGGEWAKALPAREGRSAAPLITDTLSAHQAELSTVHWSKSEAWGLLGTMLTWAAGLVGLLALTHLMVMLARRMEWRPPVFVSSAYAVLLLVLVALPYYGSAALNRMAPVPETAMALPSEAIEAETTAEPSSGFFYNDGQDGDFRGRTENYYQDAKKALVGANQQKDQRLAATQDTVRRSSPLDVVALFEVELSQATIAANPFLHKGLVTGSDEFFMGANKRRTLGFGLQNESGVPSGRFTEFSTYLAPPGFDVFTVGAGTGEGEVRLPRGGNGRGGSFYGWYQSLGRQPDYLPPSKELANQLIDGLVASERASRELATLLGDNSTNTKRIAELQQTIREQEAVLNLYNTKAPGLLATLQPQVTGTVSHVGQSGNLVTITLRSGARNLKAGASFAVFNANEGYKGEAQVTDIDGSRRFCFARITLKHGQQIKAGDSAATNLDRDVDTVITEGPGGPTVSPAVRKRIETVLGNPQLATLVYRYLHKKSDARRAFAETLYWQPYLVTDEKGEAEVTFDVSASVTTWKVYADAHGGGRIGQGEAEFESFLPFSLDAKIPTRVSEGDKIHVPVSIVADDASTETAKVTVSVSGAVTLMTPGAKTVKLKNGRGRYLAEFVVGKPKGRGQVASINILGECDGSSDRVVRQFVIVPRGFPHRVDHAATINGEQKLRLTVPDQLAKRTADWALTFYPSPLANLEQALQGMLREPHGCFEQVSSSNYPNVMILSLMETSGDSVPTVAARAEKMLANGYKKLSGYEVDGGGFEWWGKKPAHAALTAYGLLQFTDMAKVFDGVDQEMVARTRTWLLGKRNGEGGFTTGGGRYGHFMGGSAESRSAYISYALLYSGEPAAKLKPEVDFLVQRAKTTKNAYELAVIACALGEAKRPEASAARQRLLELQEKDGSLLGTGSITGSGKRDLRVETTSFAVLAWLSDAGKEYDAQIERAVRFLEKSRSGGTFGGTQATVMALKALSAYMNANTQSLKKGHINVFVGDKQIASRQLFGNEKRAIVLKPLAQHLRMGNNNVRIVLTNGNSFPFGSQLTYRADVPSSSPDCALDLGTYLTKPVIEEGQTTALHAVVKNKTNKPVANPMVIVGLPAGLHVSSKILDDLKKAETIAAWELTDQTIVLYLRGLKANEARDITIDVTGRIPGKSKGPASRAYLYYAATHRKWTNPIEVTITPTR